MRRILYAVLALAFVPPALAREQIRVVGSTSVFPFSAAAAEHFGRESGYATPIVEGTGTGGGIKMFCEGVGKNTADIVNASRPMKPAEREQCRHNGVEAITELTLGFDGLTLVNAKEAGHYPLSRRELFLALAQEVPVGGKLVRNPYRRWDEINPALPHQSIALYGPPPTSGTRDAFVDLVMLEGCKQFPEFRAAYAADEAFKQHCSLIREDGHYIQASDDGNLIVQKLINNPDALGVLSYSYLEQNGSFLKPHPVEGVMPTIDMIVAGKYPLSRHLLIYVKDAHLDQREGLKAFLYVLVSESAIGEDGYLMLKGLLPLPLTQREAMRSRVSQAQREKHHESRDDTI